MFTKLGILHSLPTPPAPHTHTCALAAASQRDELLAHVLPAQHPDERGGGAPDAVRDRLVRDDLLRAAAAVVVVGACIQLVRAVRARGGGGGRVHSTSVCGHTGAGRACTQLVCEGTQRQ